jgi:hypothetical protein
MSIPSLRIQPLSRKKESNIFFTQAKNMPQRSIPRLNKRQSSSISSLTVTHIRLPGAIESYTQGEKNIDGDSDPTKSGSTLTYGPYTRQEPTTSLDKIKVHYEYTAPIAYVEHLQRDIEVSHWGNNLAIEEHYKLTNHAAKSPPLAHN